MDGPDEKEKAHERESREDDRDAAAAHRPGLPGRRAATVLADGGVLRTPTEGERHDPRPGGAAARRLRTPRYHRGGTLARASAARGTRTPRTRSGILTRASVAFDSVAFDSFAPSSSAPGSSAICSITPGAAAPDLAALGFAALGFALLGFALLGFALLRELCGILAGFRPDFIGSPPLSVPIHSTSHPPRCLRKP